jgi:two-component system NarL family sensor kinase
VIGRVLHPQEPARDDRLLAVVRVLVVPVAFAAERLVPHPEVASALFDPLLLLGAAWALLTLGLALGERQRAPRWAPAVDVVLLVALLWTSGGPFSQLVAALFVVPVAAALLGSPAATALAASVAVAAYLLLALVHPARDARPNAVELEAVQALFLAWTGLAATLLSVVLARRTSQVAALAASRGRLVTQALAAESAARRRLAEDLHDDALQNLLASRQELDADDADLDLVRLGLDRTVARLRDAVFDLHPYLLKQAGLGPALGAVAEQAARRAGFAPHVDVAADLPSARDELLFSVGRELITNVAKHARAANLWVGARAVGNDVELEVRDDGVGLDLAALDATPLTGHIGLASCAERVEAVGGTLVVEGAPGRGTRVRARVPAARHPAEPLERDASAT